MLRFSARQDGRNARPHRTFPDKEFAFPGNERLEADLDTGNVSDGIEGSGVAVKGNAEITSARPR